MSLVSINCAVLRFANIEKEVPAPVPVDYSDISDAYTALTVIVGKIVVWVGIPDWESMTFSKEMSSIDFVFCRYGGGRRYRGRDEYLLEDHAAKKGFSSKLSHQRLYRMGTGNL
jgi:hypothetical protein